MNEKRKQQSAAIWFAHPGFTCFVSILSLAGSIGSAVLLSSVGEAGRVRLILATAIGGTDFDLAVVRVIARSFSHVWLSAILGIVIGVPCMLFYKRMLGRHVELLAGLHVMRPSQRVCWSALRVTFPLTLCSLMQMVIAGVICWYARIAIVPAVLASCVPYALLYPEQARIYNLARAKLGSTGG
jgi:hypothetical protein